MVKFLTVVFLALGIIEQITCNSYCTKYGNSHTMCKSTPGSKCGSEYQQFKFTSSQISQLLKLHNDVRQKAASGNEAKAKGGALPKSSNMCVLKWDNELANIAQNLADQCDYGHDCNSCRYVLDRNRFYNVGQNIALSGVSAKASNSMALFLRGADLWYSKEVGLFSKDNIKNYRFNPETGHYSQMIWAETCSIGCGGSIFKSGGFYRYYIVCNYGEAGNYFDDPVYKTGTPCSACKSGSSCSSSYPSLCA